MVLGEDRAGGSSAPSGLQRRPFSMRDFKGLVLFMNVVLLYEGIGIFLLCKLCWISKNTRT